MWIIPNNFRACPSARDMAASRLDSNEQAFACAQSLMWRGKHSPQRTWSQRLKREKWLRLLSGRMLRPSHTQTFTDEWASCLPVIPASRSARQAKEKEKQTSATCGHSLQGELPLASPDLCSAKMSRDTLPLGLRTFLATWGQWVTATRQDYLARRKSAQHTGENGCSGLQNWPTARATDAKGHSMSKVQRIAAGTMEPGKAQLREWVLMDNDGQPVQGNPSTDGKNREQWATPTAAQAEKPQGPNSKQVGQANGKLNPNWVEQLMGLDPGRTQLPTEWTGCDFLATESCRKQQQRHSQRYGND